MIYLIITVFSVLFILFVISLVVKNKLLTKYSVLWLFCSFFLVVASISVNHIDYIAERLGVYYPPAMIFLFGMFFLFIYTLHLSIVATKQSYQIITLTQTVSILKERVDQIENPKIKKSTKKEGN